MFRSTDQSTNNFRPPPDLQSQIQFPNLQTSHSNKRKSTTDHETEVAHTKLTATDPMDTSTDYCWEQSLMSISRLEAHLPTLPHRDSLRTTIPAVASTVFDQLETFRSHIVPPNTLGRQHFQRWAAMKSPDDHITEHHQTTLAQYITIIATENHRELTHWYRQDFDSLLELAIIDRHHLSAEAHHALSTLYQASEAQHRLLLDGLISDTFLSIGLETPPNNDTTDCTQILTNFADLVLIDTPITPTDVSSATPPCADDIPADPTIARRRTNRLLTEAELAVMQCIHTYTPVSPGEVQIAVDIIDYIRTDGTNEYHPSDCTMPNTIKTISYPDTATYWGTYIAIIGYKLRTNFSVNLRNLNTIIQPWIPDTPLDEAWMEDRHYDNANALIRYRHESKSVVLILKLSKRTLFGTFYWRSVHSGKVHPIAFESRDASNDIRHLYALRDPFDLFVAQQPSRCPPLLAIRGLPVHQDHCALTSATMLAIHQALDSILPEKTCILPTRVYHPSVKIGRSDKGINRTIRSHPNLNSQTRSLPITHFGELVLEIIYSDYTDTTDDPDQGYKAAKDLILQLISMPINGIVQRQQPFLHSFYGIELECLLSAADCDLMPRRHFAYNTLYGIYTHGIFPGMTAYDVLTILARDPANRPHIRLLLLAVILPCVDIGETHLPWRLLTIGLRDSRLITTQPLLLHNASIPFDEAIKNSHGVVSGLGDYQQLLQMYNEYLSQQDRFLPPAPPLITNKPTDHANQTPITSSQSINTAPQRTIKVSNFSSRVPTSQPANTRRVTFASSTPSLSTPLTETPVSTALSLSTPHPSADASSTTLPTSSVTIHSGAQADLLQYVEKIVTNLVHQQMAVRDIRDAELHFLRNRNECLQAKRQICTLKQKLSELDQHSPAAADLNDQLELEQRELKRTQASLRRQYDLVISNAKQNNIQLSELTGDETVDFL